MRTLTLTTRLSDTGRPNCLAQPLRASDLVVALSLAIILTFLPRDWFPDYQNYLRYARMSDVHLAQYWTDGGPVAVLVNEPVWLLLNYLASSLLGPEQVVRLIVFASSFVTTTLLLRDRRVEPVWVLVLLLSPLMLKNFTTHLRQGLGIAFYLAGYYSNRRAIRVSLMGIAPFIHASFFFVVPLYLTVLATEKLRLSGSLRLANAVVVGVALGVASISVAAFLGARQIQYTDSTGFFLRGLGFGFLFWFAVMVLFVAGGQQFLRRNSFGVSAVAFYVGSYMVLLWTGRVFESMVFATYMSGHDLPPRKQRAFKVGFAAFFVMTWLQSLVFGSRTLGIPGLV